MTTDKEQMPDEIYVRMDSAVHVASPSGNGRFGDWHSEGCGTKYIRADLCKPSAPSQSDARSVSGIVVDGKHYVPYETYLAAALQNTPSDENPASLSTVIPRVYEGEAQTASMGLHAAPQDTVDGGSLSDVTLSEERISEIAADYYAVPRNNLVLRFARAIESEIQKLSANAGTVPDGHIAVPSRFWGEVGYCLSFLDMDYTKNPKTKGFVGMQADQWSYSLNEARLIAAAPTPASLDDGGEG